MRQSFLQRASSQGFVVEEGPGRLSWGPRSGRVPRLGRVRWGPPRVGLAREVRNGQDTITLQEWLAHLKGDDWAHATLTGLGDSPDEVVTLEDFRARVGFLRWLCTATSTSRQQAEALQDALRRQANAQDECARAQRNLRRFDGRIAPHREHQSCVVFAIPVVNGAVQTRAEMQLLEKDDLVEVAVSYVEAEIEAENLAAELEADGGVALEN